MRIGYLGAGTWGTALASLLADNGHEVKVWDRNKELLKILDETREHPKLEGYKISKQIKYVSTLEEAISDIDVLVESVTSFGVRPVFEEINRILNGSLPFLVVLTSKGIEKGSFLLFPEIVMQIFGKQNKEKICCLTGPSHAEEVVKGMPTVVMGSSFSFKAVSIIRNIFDSENFNVYPHEDILGMSFGGGIKNIIAIMCAISDAVGFGINTKAALMTFGLEEAKRLAKAKGCNSETLNGLTCLGDLFVTCGSTLSRNYQFGALLAQGFTVEEAQEKIGMVVEGINTCNAIFEFVKNQKEKYPFIEMIYKIIYEKVNPKNEIKKFFKINNSVQFLKNLLGKTASFSIQNP